MTTKLAIAFLFTCLCLTAQQPLAFTPDGQLKRPQNYREWVFLSSGLGMTYNVNQHAAENTPRFDNVFVEPGAYREFLKTGTWPDQTIFVLEVRASRSEGSINRGGRYQDAIVGMEVEVKDRSRFKNSWAFFDFSKPQAETAKMIPAGASCYSCHSENGAVDNTFVQFYPTLRPIAKAKGTFKSRDTE